MPSEEPLTGPVDQFGSWHIKSVSTATRAAVTEAAHRENLTVGQWLEKRVREWTRAGSPMPVQQLVVNEGGLMVLERAVAAAVALASAPAVPISFRRRANRLLRESLGKPVPRSAGTAAPALPPPEPPEG